VNRKGQRTGEILGKSNTPHSFLDDTGKPVVGAVLDPKSDEGLQFLSKLFFENPIFIYYAWYARNNKKYDIKARGIENVPQEDQLRYMYRGSKDANGYWGSARDYGNFGAGMVAGRNGLSWKATRLGLDAYQGYKTSGVRNFIGPFGEPIIGTVEEAPVTYKAEWLGFIYGRYMRN
jgi:hypothetical protein